jgi:sulfate adenylyltransferase subunit 1
MSAIEHIPEFGSPVDNGLLRFLTCGSVDDGKSTLIGRLLYDTKTILADTLHAIEKTSLKRGMEAVDLSLLTDGLQAEREQGITIDVAYRYFTTGTPQVHHRRRAGPRAIHAQHGHRRLDRQPRDHPDRRAQGRADADPRHSYLAHLVGIPHLVVAVNKMDLVGYDQAVFERIRAEYLEFARQAGHRGRALHSAVGAQRRHAGRRGDNLAWYEGPTLIDILESRLPRTAKARALPLSGAIRLPSAGFRRSAAARLPRLHGPCRIRRDRRRRRSRGAAVRRRSRVKDISLAAAHRSAPSPNSRLRCCWKTRSTSRAAT